MSAETSRKRPLTQLNHEIEQTEAEAARLEAARKAVARDAARAERWLRYLWLARWLRAPAASFDMWPTVVLIVGSGLVGLLLFVITHLVFGAFLLALLGLILGLAAGTALLGALLYRPPDTVLQSAIADAETKRRLENARLTEKTQRLTEVNERLQWLIDERRDQIASGKLQRAALLQRNWKAMQGIEWEDFIVEVCRTHGASVERTGRQAGQDANLIADYGGRRVAVFTEGEAKNVSSATIQKALLAKDNRRCDACAVIINRRFTGAAQDFAERNGCRAIGALEFPDFVLGKIEL